MSQLFTATDVTATNGNKFIQVNTGDDVSLISPNSWIQIGNGRIQEVKTVNTSATPQTIELFDNWNGASGSGQSAISAPTAAEIKAAAEEIRQLRVTYEGIAGEVNVSAAANSIVKRDSNGRLKAAAPVASDDVVNRGYLGSAATKDVGTSAGNVMEVGAFGLGASVTIEAKDWNSALKAGFWRSTLGGGQANSPDDSQAGWYGFVAGLNDNNIHQQVTLPSSSNSRTYMRTMQSGIWSPWVELYHSGNTNFNEFGGQQTSDDVAIGIGVSSSLVNFNIPINSHYTPSGITVEGTFEVENVSRQTIGAGISSFTINGRTSNRVMVLSVTGLSGVVVGDIYHLSTESASSKITVNF